MSTFVSGLETLYVAGCIILLHSHLFPQRLGSHPVNDTVTNLQRQTHIMSHVTHTRTHTLVSFPFQVHVCGFVSFLPRTCFACCLKLSFTVSGSILFHSAAMQRNTSAPPFRTWWAHRGSVVSLPAYPCLTYRGFLLFTINHWPAEVADPWTDEPTLSTPAGNNQLLISFLLQCCAKRQGSHTTDTEVTDQLKTITSLQSPENGTKACLMLTEKVGPCPAAPAAPEGTAERLFFLKQSKLCKENASYSINSSNG